MVKPITYSSLQPPKKPNVSKLPPSANKLQRRENLDSVDMGNGRQGIKDMPHIKLARPPKLPQLNKVLDSEKQKAFSQNDISTRTKRLEKLSTTGKKKVLDEKNAESSYSIYGPGTETKRAIDTIVKTKETEDIVEKPLEAKSLNIVQKKLSHNRDNWFDMREIRNPRKESSLGSYLSQALHEVTNLTNGALTQAASPRDNFGLEIKGQAKEKEKERVVERRVRMRRESGSEKEAGLQEHVVIPVQKIVASEPRLIENKTGQNELKKLLKRPNSKVKKDRKKDKVRLETESVKQEDNSKIEEYRFDDGASDEDLSLDEYLKAKKENQENYETEIMEYDYRSNIEIL